MFFSSADSFPSIPFVRRFASARAMLTTSAARQSNILAASKSDWPGITVNTSGPGAAPTLAFRFAVCLTFRGDGDGARGGGAPRRRRPAATTAAALFFATCTVAIQHFARRGGHLARRRGDYVRFHRDKCCAAANGSML